MDCWDIFGVCVEKRLELGDAILILFGFLGLLSVYFAYRQLKFGQRAQQTQIAIHLHDDFFNAPELRAFLYRLDYTGGERAWIFNPETFPHSDEEKHLDLLLGSSGSSVGGSGGNLEFWQHASKDLQS